MTSTATGRSTEMSEERRKGERRVQFGRRQEDLIIPPSTDASLAARRRSAEIGMRLQSLALRGLGEIEAKIARGEPSNMTADEVKDFIALAAELIGGDDKKRLMS